LDVGDRLCICLPSGRMLDEVIGLLEMASFDVEPLRSRDRELFVCGKEVCYVIAKPFDVVVYVSSGMADLGFVGSDVIAERGLPVVELLDTGLGFCRMVVAVKRGEEDRIFDLSLYRNRGLRVASKYPNVARKHFASRGLHAQVVEVSGSVELACRVGLSDCIVDLVQSGRTLAQNDLVEAETIFPVSTRVIGGPVKVRTKDHLVLEALKALESAVGHLKGVK